MAILTGHLSEAPAADIALRSAGAAAVALAVSLAAGPAVIGYLRGRKVQQYIRRHTGADAVDLSQMHAGKAGTPTMGGILMAGGMVAGLGVFGDWTSPAMLLVLGMALGFGAIGFIDDYRKLFLQNGKGLTAVQKLVLQAILGTAFGTIFLTVFAGAVAHSAHPDAGAATLALPLPGGPVVALGLAYIPFAALVLTGASNAVNLTDGLDGLAAGTGLVAALCLGTAAAVSGLPALAAGWELPSVAGAAEAAVAMGALLGACAGFLRFNRNPAKVFMGDTGSMMIGGALAAAALVSKMELLLLVVGGVFVAEAGSVILQVASVKLRGRRVFLMSPLHHHFERVGWPETVIVSRFWLAAALLGALGLAMMLGPALLRA